MRAITPQTRQAEGWLLMLIAFFITLFMEWSLGIN